MNTPRISESAIRAEGAYESFKLMLAYASNATKLTGLELIDEIETHVDRFKAASYEHALLSELIRRYEKAAQVVRPEEEYPEPTPEDLREIERIEAEIEADKDKVLYYVIRFWDGTFSSSSGVVTGIKAATQYPSQEAANEVAETLTGATVVEVVS